MAPVGLVQGWRCSMSPHSPATLWCKQCPWQRPQLSGAWEVWRGCVHLFHAAPPVTLWRQPGTRHRFAPARLGLGCGSSTPRPHGTDGDSACLVAVPSRQAVVAGAQSHAPVRLFSSLLGGERGQKIKGGTKASWKLLKAAGAQSEGGRQRGEVRYQGLILAGRGLGSGGTSTLTRSCISLLPLQIIPPRPISSPLPIKCAGY